MADARAERMVRSTCELLESCAYRIRVLHFVSELPQAQWAALRFFDHCNASVANVTSFATLHGLTHGTASRTVAHLVRKGLVARSADAADRRRKVLWLTARGRRALTRDPLSVISAALEKFRPSTLHEAASVLSAVAGALAASTTGRAKARAPERE
jgi:DNA-binding MarR family transcriptional regulator